MLSWRGVGACQRSGRMNNESAWPLLDFLGKLLLSQSHCSLHSCLSCLHPLDSVLINHTGVETYLFLLVFPCFWNTFFEVFPNDSLGFVGDDSNVFFQSLYSFGSSLGRTLTLVFTFSENQLFVASILYVALSVSLNFYPDIDYFSHLLICCLFSPVSLQCQVTHLVICPCGCCLLCRHSELQAFFLETSLLYPKGCNWLCFHFNFLLRRFNCLPDFSMIIQEFIVQTPHIVIVSLSIYF